MMSSSGLARRRISSEEQCDFEYNRRHEESTTRSTEPCKEALSASAKVFTETTSGSAEPCQEISSESEECCTETTSKSEECCNRSLSKFSPLNLFSKLCTVTTEACQKVGSAITTIVRNICSAFDRPPRNRAPNGAEFDHWNYQYMMIQPCADGLQCVGDSCFTCVHWLVSEVVQGAGYILVNSSHQCVYGFSWILQNFAHTVGWVVINWLNCLDATVFPFITSLVSTWLHLLGWILANWLNCLDATVFSCIDSILSVSVHLVTSLGAECIHGIIHVIFGIIHALLVIGSGSSLSC